MFTWDRGDLNQDQEDAIFDENSILLIACPGSGKTRTLTYKIAYELSRIKTSKEFIIAITYTNNAADEIKERVENLGVDTNQLWIGTIHSFCLEWILRPYGLYIEELKNGFRIINSHESEEIISKLCKLNKNNKISYWDCSFTATTTGFTITSYKVHIHEDIKSILLKYFEILEHNNQIDFEQILYYSNKLLTESPIIGSILSKIFPFILIDEYQDTKSIQYHIISSILKPNLGKSRTLIVGDPNQSIYESLGGFPMEKTDLEALLGFKLVKRTLTYNYRSSAKIIKYFDYFKTHDNPIIPLGSHKEYNSIITFNSVVNKLNLVDEISKLILFNIKEKEIHPNEICIVAPQWVHLASLTRSLMIKLPDYSFDGPGMAPFSRDIDNFWYKLSRILLTEPSPNLYVRRLRWSRETIEELHNAGVDVSKITTKSFLKICNSLNSNEKNGLMHLKFLFDEICLELKFELSMFPMLEEHYNSFFDSSTKRIEKLEKEGNEFIGSIDSFRKVFKQREGITVSTIHGVKGEEYDTMIAFALLEDYIPNFNDKINGQLNAKKLLYVLSSRARKNIHLISERGRLKSYGSPPPEYLINNHLNQYKYIYDII